MSGGKEPILASNPSLQKYYSSLESRIGYKLVLGGTRHFGYYDRGTIWPFPINAALRRMEDNLFKSLGVKSGGQVLDAGCGVAHVAIHFARKGLLVQGIDFMPRHIQRAEKNIEVAGLGDSIKVRWMDYHHLDVFDDASYDGVYTMETFVHATDPRQALKEFFRVLKPGGRIAMYEYDHVDFDDPKFEQYRHLKAAADQINDNAAMPANAAFKRGVLQSMMEEAGFRDVQTKDLSENIKPMLRLFFVLAYIPYLIISLLGLKTWFVNTQAGVEGYRILGNGLFRFIGVTATKPTKLTDGESGLRERKNLAAGVSDE